YGFHGGHGPYAAEGCYVGCWSCGHPGFGHGIGGPVGGPFLNGGPVGPIGPGVPVGPELGPRSVEPKKGLESALPNRARLIVEVPANAKLFIDDRPIQVTSEKRSFSTP